MDTVVDVALLLDEVREGRPLYSGSPGTVYEVAPGVRVTLRPPTMTLQEEYQRLAVIMQEESASIHKKADEGSLTPIDKNRRLLDAVLPVAKLCTQGTWPNDTGQLLFNVVVRVTQDFIKAARLISQPETPLSKAQLQYLELALDKLGGQANGQSVEVEGT